MLVLLLLLLLLLLPPPCSPLILPLQPATTIWSDVARSARTCKEQLRFMRAHRVSPVTMFGLLWTPVFGQGYAGPGLNRTACLRVHVCVEGGWLMVGLMLPGAARAALRIDFPARFPHSPHWRSSCTAAPTVSLRARSLILPPLMLPLRHTSHVTRHTSHVTRHTHPPSLPSLQPSAPGPAPTLIVFP
jgi:hypothetical protein